MRRRAIAELALAVNTGGDVERAVPAAFMAGVEPHEIAELGGADPVRDPSARVPRSGLLRPGHSLVP